MRRRALGSGRTGYDPPMHDAMHDPQRRQGLLLAKARVLLKRYWPETAGADAVPGAGGVTVRHGDAAWVLVDDPDPGRGFARALLWGLNRGVGSLHILVDAGPGAAALARRAAEFRTPVGVWAVAGTTVEPVAVEPLASEPPLDPEAETFIPVIRAAGADPVVEWGTLTAEVLGLQVGRVCAGEDGMWLDVGIGEHDRLANLEAWGDLPPEDALSRVVEVARAARAGPVTQPLNRLGRERWLRSRVVADPPIAGAVALEPVAPPVPQADLRSPLLAPAAGTATGGRPVLVACSVGVDATFVPMAAELAAARGRFGPRPVLVLVTPASDLHPLTRRAVKDLQVPAAVVTVADDWHDAVANRPA
jgi:hypothetical protein